MQMPNVLGLLFGLAQMGLYFMYRNPKKNGAVSELQVVEVQAADDIKDQQQLQTTHHVADGEVASSEADDASANKDDIVVDILPQSPPQEEAPPLPHPPPAMPIVAQHAIEVV